MLSSTLCLLHMGRGGWKSCSKQRLFVSDSLLMAFVTPLRLLAPLAASQVRSAAWCSSAVVMSSRFGLSHHPVWMVHPMDDTACAGLSCRQLPRHPVCEGRGV